MEQKKYIITHPEFENHAPAELHGLQVYAKPYLEEMIVFWWLVFFATSSVLVYIFLRRVYEVHFAVQQHTQKTK